jgi:hypothetical protein
MSRAEAQEFLKEAGPKIAKDVEAALTDSVVQTARKEAFDTAHRYFEEQLNATGKYRPEVNKAMAAVPAAYYATQAQRAGMTVEDFMDRYQLRITKKDGGGQQRLEQGEYRGPTMAEINALSGIPTVDVMREAIAAVGEAAFQKRAQAKIDTLSSRGKFKVSESMIVEATAREIVALARAGRPQLSRGEGGASTAEAMRTELRARFGDIVDSLEERGVLKLWDGIDAFNEAGGQLSEDFRGAQGMFLNGAAHIFGDGVMPGNAIPVFLHEVGEHASMKAMLGKRYPVLVKRAYALAKQGDPIAVQALMRIPENTPKKFMDSEMVAYLIEEAAGREDASDGVKAWLLDVIAAVKAFLFEKGVDIDLTPKEIAALAVRAVKFQAAQEGRPGGSEVDIALSKADNQRAIVELRKRESVLNSLLECLGAA